ncbi:hypothetical protein RMR21_004360 [Agrobacterium sp. rho-8.1]|nr:hypothetical protein [Agrobacterium sp. rho-8.1]
MEDVNYLMAAKPRVRWAVRTAHREIKRLQHGISHPLDINITRNLIAKAFAAQNLAFKEIAEASNG